MDFILVIKSGWFWQLLAGIVRAVTFGRNTSFLSGYATTIGPWIAVPTSWDLDIPASVEQRALLAHESVHVAQFTRAGLWLLLGVGAIGLGLAMSLTPLWAIAVAAALATLIAGRRAWAVVGIVPVGVAYLLLPLPIGLAWCRYALERSAYAHQAEALIAVGWDRAKLIDRAVEQLATGAYGWAWPFPAAVRGWFEKRLPQART